MRILFFDTFTWRGGVQSVTRRTITGLARRGHHCIVVDPFGDVHTTLRLPEDPRIEIVSLRLPMRIKALRIKKAPASAIWALLRSVVYIKRLRRIIRELSVDLVWTNFPKSMVWSLPAARSERIPIVFHCHGVVKQSDMGWWYRYCLRNVDLTIAVSEGTKRQIETAVGQVNEVEVVYNSLEESWLDCAEDQVQTQDLRKEWRVSDSEIAFLFAGNLIHRKGVDVLLRAYGEAYRRGAVDNSKLIIVGEDVEGRAETLKELAKKQGIEDQVRFLGYRSDILRLMDAADVFVLPSRMESFGVVLAEAMSRGKPVISTNTASIPEVVRHMETGILVPVEDSGALADALALLYKDRHLRTRLGQNGREDVAKRFSLTEQSIQLDLLIERLEQVDKT